MQFDQYRPRHLLGPVERIWEQRSSGAGAWRILPSGWVELIFRLGPPFSLQKARLLRPDAAPIRQSCFLSGLHMRPLDLAFDTFHVFGVRLHPVAVRAFFGLPCTEVRDNAVEGAIVIPDLARIEDRLRSAPDFLSRARWMERELFSRLCRHDAGGAAKRMLTLATGLPVTRPVPGRELLRRLGYSRSHAHRVFNEWFGQSTAATIRLARFVRAMHQLHGGSGSLADVAYRLGYYDQAHFIHQFREYAGMTPGEYRRRKGLAPEQLAL
jgi:AraC-like DNA-binding protein